MRMFVTAAVAALVTIAIPAAHAATPAQGQVSETQLTQTWSGEADGEPVDGFTETKTHQLCIQPFCDTFTLNVHDLGTALRVYFNAPHSAKFVDVLVTKPDGSTELFEGNDSEAFKEIIYKKAPVGNYIFDIWTNQVYGVLAGPYDAQAELCSASVKFADCFVVPDDEETF